MADSTLINALSTGPGGTRSYRQLEQSGRILEGDDAGGIGVDRPQEQGEFFNLVSEFLGDVNHLQARSGDARKAFVAGEITDLHQVMVAGQEAGIALDLMIEIRNRVMESFQEIMRIQV